jgi:hypothetical protein
MEGGEGEVVFNVVREGKVRKLDPGASKKPGLIFSHLKESDHKNQHHTFTACAKE